VLVRKVVEQRRKPEAVLQAAIERRRVLEQGQGSPLSEQSVLAEKEAAMQSHSQPSSQFDGAGGSSGRFARFWKSLACWK
jgi:hypothetical protein